MNQLTGFILSIFLCVMVVINTWIAFVGMGVRNGWIGHIFLALAAASCGGLLPVNACTSVRESLHKQKSLDAA
ncbi:MAG: hypothetical protein ACJ0GY_07530 [Synechococcus sp.]